MVFGSMPNDAGNLSDISREEAQRIRDTDPTAAKYLRRLVGAQELINNQERWCLWLKDATPQEIRKSPELLKRSSAVKAFRLSSSRQATRRDAVTPHLFHEDRQPSTRYLAVPSVSSETRKYVPMALFEADVITNNLVLTISNADLYTFGMLHSSVFMAWNATVSGRLESRFRISAEITYNTFPWPDNPANRNQIEGAAQAVIDARDGHPTASLADLYDPLAMPKDLVEAHRTLDGLVLAAYGLKKDATENEILTELFKRYQQLTEGEQLNFEQNPNRKKDKK